MVARCTASSDVTRASGTRQSLGANGLLSFAPSCGPLFYSFLINIAHSALMRPHGSTDSRRNKTSAMTRANARYQLSSSFRNEVPLFIHTHYAQIKVCNQIAPLSPHAHEISWKLTHTHCFST